MWGVSPCTAVAPSPAPSSQAGLTRTSGFQTNCQNCVSGRAAPSRLSVVVRRTALVSRVSHGLTPCMRSLKAAVRKRTLSLCATPPGRLCEACHPSRGSPATCQTRTEWLLWSWVLWVVPRACTPATHHQDNPRGVCESRRCRSNGFSSCSAQVSSSSFSVRLVSVNEVPQSYECVRRRGVTTREQTDARCC